MKANSKFYKGIEYIVVSELPAEQQSLLEQVKIEQIKILIDGKIISNCISYQSYSDWFHTVFKQRIPVARAAQKESMTGVNISLNKA